MDSPAPDTSASTFELPIGMVERLENEARAQGNGSPAEIVQKALDWFLTMRTPAAIRDLERLTRRQREVLIFAAQGLSTKEIALQLGISVKTVETYRTQLMNTLQLKGAADLVRFAVRSGVIPLLS